MKILKWTLIGFLFFSGLGFFIFGGLMTAAAIIGVLRPEDPDYKATTNIAGLIAHGIIPFVFGVALIYCSASPAWRHGVKRIAIGCVSPFLLVPAILVGGGLILATYEHGTSNGMGIFLFGIIPFMLAIYTIAPLFRTPIVEVEKTATNEARNED